MDIKNIAAGTAAWIMVAALIVVVVTIGLELANVETVYKATGYRVHVVMSDSMSPKIDQGSLVFARQLDVNDLQEGDIITFVQPGNKQIFVTHRIYGVLSRNAKPSGFITKGDANTDKDPMAVEPGQVVGKVVWQIPWAGYVVGAVKSRIGYFLLVLIPGLIIITQEMLKLKGWITDKKFG